MGKKFLSWDVEWQWNVSIREMFSLLSRLFSFFTLHSTLRVVLCILLCLVTDIVVTLYLPKLASPSRYTSLTSYFLLLCILHSNQLVPIWILHYKASHRITFHSIARQIRWSGWRKISIQITLIKVNSEQFSNAILAGISFQWNVMCPLCAGIARSGWMGNTGTHKIDIR